MFSKDNREGGLHMSKRELSEKDIKARYITPAVERAG